MNTKNRRRRARRTPCKKFFSSIFFFELSGNFFFFNLCKTVKRAPTKSGQNILKLVCLFIGSFWGKNLFFLAFWNNGKLHSKFSPIFFTKHLFLKNNVKSLPKTYFTFLTKKINVWRGSHQIMAKIFKRQYFRSYGLWDLILQFSGFCPEMTIAIFSAWIQSKRTNFHFPHMTSYKVFWFFRSEQSRLKFEEKQPALIWWGTPFTHWFLG